MNRNQDETVSRGPFSGGDSLQKSGKTPPERQSGCGNLRALRAPRSCTDTSTRVFSDRRHVGAAMVVLR
jgi:hypothetical protein